MRSRRELFATYPAGEQQLTGVFFVPLIRGLLEPTSTADTLLPVSLPDTHQRTRYFLTTGTAVFENTPGRWSLPARSDECLATLTADLHTDNSGAASRSAPTCLYRFGHRSARGTPDQCRVLGKDTFVGIRPCRFPGCAAPPQLASGKLDAELAFHRVDADAVAGTQEPYWTAEGGFRRDMTNNKPVTAPRKAAVRDEGNLIAKATPDDGARRAQHLAHARTATRSLAADHYDITGLHRSAQDRGGCALFALEDACPALEALALLPGDLGDGALGSEVAVEDHEMAGFLQRSSQWMNNALSAHIHRHVFQILLHGVAGHGEAIRVQKTALQQHLHQRLDAADRDQVRHEVTAARLEVRQHRHPPADTREVIECQLDPGLVRNREQVQDGVGRAAECDDDGDGVLEGPAR